MPSLDITFCSDGQRCKQRNKCWRFVGVESQDENAMYWQANFYEEAKASGRKCAHFIEL